MDFMVIKFMIIYHLNHNNKTIENDKNINNRKTTRNIK